MSFESRKAGRPGASQLDMHAIVVVWVPAEVQVERTMARDACTRDEAERRMAAQLPLDEKRDLADHADPQAWKESQPSGNGQAQAATAATCQGRDTRAGGDPKRVRKGGPVSRTTVPHRSEVSREGHGGRQACWVPTRTQQCRPPNLPPAECMPVPWNQQDTNMFTRPWPNSSEEWSR